MPDFLEMKKEHDRKERLKITRRNLFCDLLGEWITKDGEKIVILRWENAPNPGIMNSDNAIAAFTYPDSDDPEEVYYNEYYELLNRLDRNWDNGGKNVTVG
jgi:hypothetical protein